LWFFWVHKKEFVMDVKFRNMGFQLGSAQWLFLAVCLLPFGSANATSSIARSVSSACAPAATSPDVGSCSACHTSGSPSLNDLNAAGNQALSNPTFFCPAPAPTPAPVPTPTPTPAPTPAPGTGTGTGAMGSGMTGMSGRRSGMSGMGSGFRLSFGGDDDDDSERDDD
jgi:hypothetical protein